MKLKIELIDDWFKKLFTLASTRVAWVASCAVAYFAANPDQWTALMSRLPWWGPIAVGMSTMMLSGGSRVVTFKKGE